ncbi:unnamed protein product [Onchocerca flexuosa]|uniref:Ovule protein n=1 Tax=Onchocerca flexuosa TaxID=387005 RepID=A0A183I248_9BILA|nr:unnamed protein product [Onchocerca flexuosa]
MYHIFKIDSASSWGKSMEKSQISSGKRGPKHQHEISNFLVILETIYLEEFKNFSLLTFDTRSQIITNTLHITCYQCHD